MAEPTRSFVVAVDKPLGPTSHDVVAWARRAFGTRAVGHAGTLDPAATGVLVLAVGEATKLVPYLTLDDKEYDAEIALGVETDSLDAQGAVIAEAAVPPLDEATLRAALAEHVGAVRQRPPIFSAIKMEGVPLHKRARRGEDVEVPERDVEAFSIDARLSGPSTVHAHLHVGKGYYVRSFARDLARSLGTLGHLVGLRRTRSGTFRLSDALDGALLQAAGREPSRRHELAEALGRVARPLASAVALPTLSLDASLERDVRHGKRVSHPDQARLDEGAPCLLLSAEGTLVAIARREGETLRVVRGFVADQDSES